RAWLLGGMMDKVFPNNINNNASFTAPTISRTITNSYFIGVTDNRGGGVQTQSFVTVAPISSPGLPPTATLTVNPPSGPSGTQFSLSLTGSSSVGTGQFLWVASSGYP